MRKTLLAIWLSASLLIVSQSLSAETLYLDFLGTDASGDVAGTAFSGQTFTLEYAIDSTVACNPCDAMGENDFAGVILGGSIVIGGNVYSLSGGSATGTISFDSYPGNYDDVSSNPTSGGYMQFLGGTGSIFPALFSDLTSLSSANLGTTVANSVQDVFQNSDVINFGNSDAVATAIGNIDIFASTPSGSNNWSLSVNSKSQLAQSAATPEPSSVLLVLAAGACLGLRRRVNGSLAG